MIRAKFLCNFWKVPLSRDAYYKQADAAATISNN